MPKSGHVAVLIRAAQAGGRVIARWFGKSLVATKKSTASDVRTKADLGSERAILAILNRAFPDYNVIAEESGTINRGSRRTLIIDPLDGTHNFTLGLPYFSVSIALVEGHQAIAGAVYNPITKQTFSAGRGSGSFRDGRRIRVSRVRRFDHAAVVYICGYRTPFVEYEALVKLFYQSAGKRFMSFWSPAHDLALIAEGRLEGMVSNGPEVYDVAAGKLLVAEAGGVVLTRDGKPDRDGTNVFFIAANNRPMAETLVRLWRRSRQRC